MKNRWRNLLFCLFALCLLAVPCGGKATEAERPLSRGVNLGNMLDAPGEGAWGESFDCGYPKIIKEAGFDHVRLPVMWSIYAQTEAPYEIWHWIFDRVDHVIAACREAELAVILDIHNYEELAVDDPSPEKERFLSLWRQIATHYASAPGDVLFEILNEPGMPPEVWNAWIPEALAVIRESNPTRRVLISGSYWANVEALGQIDFPQDDPNLVGTIHFYQPFEFTHQGAEWASIEDVERKVAWEGTEAERQAIRQEFDAAVAWSQRTGLPVHLGEFGTFEAGEMAARARWTDCVTREAEAHGIGWSYWDFSAAFGVYDNEAKAYFQPLLEALIPETTSTQPQ